MSIKDASIDSYLSINSKDKIISAETVDNADVSLMKNRKIDQILSKKKNLK